MANKHQDQRVVLQNFDIKTDQPELSEAELFALLVEQIEYMMAHKMEYLLSLLYRMDVLEPKIEAALHPTAPEPPAIGLAKLVIERQKQRNATRKKYRQPPIIDDEEDWSF